jgi:hypothetical protein
MKDQYLYHMAGVKDDGSAFSNRAAYEFKTLWAKTSPEVRQQLALDYTGNNPFIKAVSANDLKAAKKAQDDKAKAEEAAYLAKKAAKAEAAKATPKNSKSDGLDDLLGAKPKDGLDDLLDLPTDKTPDSVKEPIAVKADVKKAQTIDDKPIDGAIVKPATDFSALSEFGITAPPKADTPLVALNNNPKGTHSNTIPSDPAKQQAYLNAIAEKKNISPKAMVKAIQDYSGSDYGDIREAYRELKKQKDETGRVDIDTEYKRQALRIKGYLDEAPKFKGATYRGLSFKTQDDLNSFLSSMTKEPTWELDTITSFSSSKKTAKEFDGGEFGVLLNVKSNQSGSSIKKLSEYASESEVLTPPGARYAITGKPTVKTDKNGNKVISITLEEVQR